MSNRPAQAALVRKGVALLAALLLGVATSCQYVPVEPHPLVGEGEPPGYIDGQIPDQYRGMRNPFALSDTAAIAAGRTVYYSLKYSCASCHGEHGRGDGPMAPYVEPGPADYASPPMVNAFRHHQDYVYWWVSTGVVKTVMPGHQDLLTETQIWQVITYAWSLGEQSASNPTAGTPQRGSEQSLRPPFLPPRKPSSEMP